MIELSRLNGQRFVLNAELIETVTANPDTTIQLTSGRTLVVAESLDTVIERTIAYRRRILAPSGPETAASGVSRVDRQK